jgi:hypothetical protein
MCGWVGIQGRSHTFTCLPRMRLLLWYVWEFSSVNRSFIVTDTSISTQYGIFRVKELKERRELEKFSVNKNKKSLK